MCLLENTHGVTTLLSSRYQLAENAKEAMCRLGRRKLEFKARKSGQSLARNASYVPYDILATEQGLPELHPGDKRKWNAKGRRSNGVHLRAVNIDRPQSGQEDRTCAIRIFEVLVTVCNCMKLQ